MSSVVRHRHVVQWSGSCFVILTLTVLLGCEPGKSEKKAAPQTSPAAKESPAPEAPAGAEQAKPAAKDLPGVESPVKDLPPPAKEAAKEPAKEPAKPPAKEPAKEPAKTPAKDPAAKTLAPESPPAAKVASQAAAGDADPTMDVTVKWLPKPVANPNSEAKDQAGMKPYTEKIQSTDVTFDMVPIPGGTYKMGSPAGEKDRKPDEGPQVEIKLEPFWMGSTRSPGVNTSSGDWASISSGERPRTPTRTSGTRRPTRWPFPPSRMPT